MLDFSNICDSIISVSVINSEWKLLLGVIRDETRTCLYHHFYFISIHYSNFLLISLLVALILILSSLLLLLSHLFCIIAKV